MSTPAGPLAGIRVVELGSIGPAPFAAMVLSDLGADVVRIDRPGATPYTEGLDHRRDILLRGRPSVAVDLKHPDGHALAVRLIDRADVLIDPFRPGVAERLGLGPEELRARHRRLVYARITGWGQDGPWAGAAGHDINYVALAGPLAAIGRAGSPPPPALNLAGDFGGGGMLVALGVLAALVERDRSGEGQVIDAAMVDGVALQLAAIVGYRQMGMWTDERESNLVDGGAPFYDTYETADGRFVSVGAIEPQFYAELLGHLGLDPEAWPQYDRARWPALHAELAAIFATRTRDEWTERLGATDACFAPVLNVDEAAAHPQNVARGVYRDAHGLLQPSPAPRFSRTPGAIRSAPSQPGEHGRSALADWGLTDAEIDALEAAGAVQSPADVSA